MLLFVIASPAWALSAAVPVLFLLVLGLGRWLKHRQGVRLGFTYWIFSAVLACWLPLQAYRRLEPAQAEGWAEAQRHLTAALAIFGTLFALALVRRFLWQSWFERTYHTRAPRFLADLSALLLFAVAVVFALSRERGQPITGLAVGSTVAAAILGLALQDLLGNLIAGIALELGKPFRPGDWLWWNEQAVEVLEVNWRSTRMRSTDNTGLDVPNRTIAGTSLVNLTMHGRQHALRTQVSFEPGLPPNLAKDRLLRALRNARGVLTAPPPKVYLVALREDRNVYELKYWIEEDSMRTDIIDAVNTSIWYEAQRSQMRIPPPTRLVQVERAGRRREARLQAVRSSLRQQPLLRMLSSEQAELLLGGAQVLRFGRGERIIRQGAEGRSMFILVSGEAEVLVEAEERETRVGDLQGGEFFGEMSLLTGEPRSATVVARVDCEVWEIDKVHLAELFQENPSLVQQISNVLAERRLETEGALAAAEPREEAENRAREYRESFLRRVTAFFEL